MPTEVQLASDAKLADLRPLAPGVTELQMAKMRTYEKIELEVLLLIFNLLLICIFRLRGVQLYRPPEQP